MSFNTNRIRTAEEPRTSAWGHGMRSGWIYGNEGFACTSGDCSLIYRGDSHYARGDTELLDEVNEPEWTFRVYPPPPTYDTKFVPLTASPEEKYDSEDDSEEASRYSEQTREIDKKLEHIAGPGCKNTQGYHGHRISVEEMRGCHTAQCLAQKGDEWALEPSDLDCELQGKSYLTGVLDRVPPVGSTLRFAPARHGTDIYDAQV